MKLVGYVMNQQLVTYKTGKEISESDNQRVRVFFELDMMADPVSSAYSVTTFNRVTFKLLGYATNLKLAAIAKRTTGNRKKLNL